MNHEKKKRTKKRPIKPKPVPSQEPERRRPPSREEELLNIQYNEHLKELRDLTRRVGDYLKQKDALDEPQPQPQLTDEADKADELYEAIKDKSPLEERPSKDASGALALNAPLETSVSPLTASLPEALQERLGLTLRYLVNDEHQDWPLILSQLEQDGGLKGFSDKDVRKMVYAIPKHQLVDLYPKVKELMEAAGMKESPKMINTYMRSVIHGSAVGPEKIQIIENCVDELKSMHKKGALSRDTYEVLIEAYGKNASIDKVNQLVKEMKQLGLEPLRTVYSNVLATCVYKVKSHASAVELFDSMKFFLKKTQPSTREYQDIIVSYVNNDNIEKALDLYQEMRTEKIEVNQSILVALARGCFSRDELKIRAWDFMFEINRRGWTPTAQSAEYMLYLALKDGDLSLARSLYQQLNLGGNTSPRSFSFLLLAYSKASLDGSVPTVEYSESGRLFRYNIMNQTDFASSMEDPKTALPFLPNIMLESPLEILAESSAIMAHTLMVNNHFVNSESINNFLNVAANVGTLDDFKQRLEQFTYLDREGIPATRSYIEPDRCLDEENGTSDSKEVSRSSNGTSLSTSPVLEQFLQASDGRFKVPRDTITYLIALKAAAKHNNYVLAQMMWTERGLYRKSVRWTRLSRHDKDKLDFDFAISMVNCLTQLGLLEDALAVVVSTEYQFKWKWHHFSQLHKRGVEIGDNKITLTLRGIAKRGQIKFEGKIHRKDYKRFVMNNGY